ncbi:response regulator transcription factor [Sphingomonas corticis]|uniref:Response regulator transcription factor n=1 Tax=Sphingomonas corticis TaxID=2722791 RepID=A0ABX1CNK5_9SPHN|nr:response regulator transcription factor [Sphingomonas corticis]NJR78518.1 response regulator transcription factor [Sphingomonas corticis]
MLQIAEPEAAEAADGGGDAAAIRVLVVEDDRVIAGEIAEFLGDRGMAVTRVADGAAALAQAGQAAWDAIVLDRMLPGIDGMEVLRRLRAVDVATPVLVLTARGSVGERIAGLEAGADDYMVKPFSLAELDARVRALVRGRTLARDPAVFRVGGLTIDAARHTASCCTRTVPLQPRETRFLIELARQPGTIVSKQVLLERVWNYHFDPRTKIVETHVSRLRAKLTTLGLANPIVSVRNVGYRLGGECG